jgi:hypothetical protein
MNTQKSRFQGLFEPTGNEPAQPVEEQVVKTDTGEETLEERKQEKKRILLLVSRLTMKSGKIMSGH